MVKNKKSQMKIQQTAFMLLAVTLFFALIGLALVGFQLSGIKKSASDLEEKNAMLLATKLANSPEFSCGESFGTKKAHCIDSDKVMMLKESEEKYAGFWGVKNIIIRKIYPKTENETYCTLANYPNCNIIEIRSKERGGTAIPNFVSLCRKESENGRVYNKCEIGLLMVSY